MFKIYGGATKFTQWTKDQKLIMSELPIGADVMFYNDPNEDEPTITEVYEIHDEEGNAIRVCDVPNIFLTETKRIKVRIPKRVRGLYGTMHSIAGQNEKYFEVEPAEKPSDYVYEKTVTNTIDPRRLPTSVPAIESASVGQVPKVAAVDENGVPTKWEAGDAGGEQVQADWNQNDETAPDYVKNRPFYESVELVDVVPEITVNATEFCAINTYSVDLPQGTMSIPSDANSATVVCDGVEHNNVLCVPGNYGYVGVLSEHSFSLTANKCFFTTQGEHTISVIFYKKNLETVDKKYLPTEEWTFTLEDGSTVTKKVAVGE